MTNFEGLLKALDGVEYIAVGGFAATTHGSARFTKDLDIVYRRSADNIVKVAAALRPYSPYLRGAPPNLPFSWDERTLKMGLNFTLETTLGWIDLLGEIVGGGSYEALLPATQVFSLFGLEVRCLSLRRLIEVKRAAGRPKDYEALAELELLLKEAESSRFSKGLSLRQQFDAALATATICVVSTRSVAAMVHADLRGDFERDFEEVRFIELPDREPTASVGDLATDVMLFLAGAFFNGFAGEAGKDAYGALKGLAPKLWRVFFGHSPTIQTHLITSAGPKPSIFSRTFSIAARTRHGGIVALQFRPDISDDDFRRAQQLFVELLKQHLAAGGDDSLTAASDFMDQALPLHRPREQRHDVVTYDPEDEQLKLVSGLGGPFADLAVTLGVVPTAGT